MKLIEFFSRNKDTDLVLRDREFRNVHFEDAVIYGDKYVMENVLVEQCFVSPGTCMLGPAGVLRNTYIVNLSCGDCLTIDSTVKMEQVVIEGAFPNRLWIRPFEERDIQSESISLDIHGFLGEVSITGVDTVNISTNPERHVKIELSRFDGVVWKDIGLSALSYWKLMVGKVRSDKSQNGVFSLPPKSGRNYNRSMKELGILRELGLVD